jgi:hypothetical protein
MGVARARVVEVHAPTSTTARVGAGYLVGDRYVLTSGRVVGRSGPTAIRPAGTATWISSSVVWAPPSGDAAALEVDDPAALMLQAEAMRWGGITGSRPVAVTGMGFGASGTRAGWPRDAAQFRGQVVPAAGAARLTVTTTGGVDDGLCGAALFAGAELVGVLLAEADRLWAVAVPAMAEDPAFVELFGDAGRLALAPVSAPAYGFPILPV